jgi:predicted nuclease of predicted toxin-antitoxin system
VIRPDLAVMKLLLDQGVPVDAAPMFRQVGHECRHVSEIGLQKAEDEEILSCARDQGCVVITLDADFHALVAVRGLSAPSVVRLRREGCRAEAAVEILGPVLERYRFDLEKGALISVKEHRVTCHRLPVGRDR